jgi:7-cyano-7-deazaguanine synthase
MNAVVLASGGLDSTVAAAVAKQDGCSLHLLTVNYGQRHRIEVDRARLVGEALGAAAHVVLNLDLRPIGGSALTADLAVPKDRSEEARGREIPITYVPARNTILLSLAAAYAEVVAASRIYFGANVLDYSGYPDCRPEFLRAFEAAVRLGTKAGTEGKAAQIFTPLLTMTKAQIIRLGLTLGAPLHLTHSCYDPSPEGAACGRCDSCRIRIEGFRAAGAPDPIAYASV